MACNLIQSSAVRVHDSQAYRKKWQGSASDVSWKWEKYSCHPKLVSTLSMLLFSVLSWRVPHAWNPHQIQLSPGTWSLWLSRASVHLLWSRCLSHWCCLSSAWFSRHWSPCRRLWKLCRDAQLIFASSSSSPAKPSMSSAKRRLVIVLPLVLTVPSWSYGLL